MGQRKGEASVTQVVFSLKEKRQIQNTDIGVNKERLPLPTITHKHTHTHTQRRTQCAGESLPALSMAVREFKQACSVFNVPCDTAARKTASISTSIFLLLTGTRESSDISGS